MATTTDNPATSVAQAGTRATLATTSRAPALVLLLVVFMSGATVMTVEMCASRLLAPYFGTALFVWGILIGLVMIYLTVGYWLGGRLADRYPRATLLYTFTAVAALWVGLIPLMSGPILRWALTGIDNRYVGVVVSSLIGVILLFSVPLVLLGFVSPFAIRLRVISAASAGGTAGAVSALSTLGSILGTFIPVFVLIPRLGTATTLYTASLALLAFSLLGLASYALYRQAGVVGLLLALVLGLALFAPRGFVKPPPFGELIFEKESAYNYIQVVKSGPQVALMLNEGHATHSVYNSERTLTGGPWDYWLVAPYFNKGFSQQDMKSMAMIGSAGGTAPQLLTKVYGPLPVDGVEIDPEIVAVGNRYFHLGDFPNIVTHQQDGRTYLSTDGRDRKWTVVGIDAYRQPYIPFHLTTKEFFEEVRSHLTPDGAAMINAGRTAGDVRLVDALAQTMVQVFPHVFVIDVPTMANSMVVGTPEAASIENFRENASRATNPILKEVFSASLDKGNIREISPEAGAVTFTDDRAPVEEVIDQMIFGVVHETGK